MTSDALENLAKIRKLKAELSSLREFDGLVRSALERSTDAKNSNLTLANRFTLALAALRIPGRTQSDGKGHLAVVSEARSTDKGRHLYIR